MNFILKKFTVFLYLVVFVTNSIIDLAVALNIKTTVNVLQDTVTQDFSTLTLENIISGLTNNINETLENLNLDNTDIYSNGTELARQNGYKVEEYEVETEDGYLLLLVRIRGKGTPVLLIHGILLCSDDWVTPGPKIGIPYALAEKGYDVWIGNARGNKYSKRHKTMSPNEAKFWDFSYHEIGIYDLPAMIDRILAVTRRDKLVYVGFSQGTTTFFIMASERPEYNAKVSLMIALAPISAANFISILFLIIRGLTNNKPQLFFKKLREAGVHEFLPRNKFISLVCSQPVFRDTICRGILDFGVGYNGQQAYRPTLSVVYSHIPSGCATKQFEHYSQAISTKRFAKFDYGVAGNLRLYSKRFPPEYPVQNITAPIALFYGDSDLLAPPKDVKSLRRQLSNVVEFYRVRLKAFGHLDFIYGKDLKKLVFDKMLELIQEYA